MAVLQRSQPGIPSPSPADDMARQAERLAAGYAPAYVIVDEADEVVLFSQGTGRFLDPSGAATLHLPSLVSRDLAADLSRLLQSSRATGSAQRADGLMVPAADGASWLCLTVEPLPEPSRLMVLFQRSAPGSTVRAAPWPAPRATIQRELHQATEEPRSLKQKRCVNEELRARVGELAQANSDIRHMLQSTQLAIVFLDGALRIRSFTPAMAELFQLIDGDVGRPLTELTARICYPELAADVLRVGQTEQTVEREVDGIGGVQRLLVRLLPDRDAAGKAVGVVLAFIDISLAHQAKRATQDSEERLHRMAASVPAFLFIAGAAGGWEYINPPFHAYTGMAADAASGWGWLAAIHPEDSADARGIWHGAAAEGAVEREIRVRRADGAWQWFLLRAVPQLDAAGTVVRWFGSCTDIDGRRQVEARQGRLLAELQHRVKNVLALVRSLLVRTVKSSPDLDHFAHHFAGRIGAIARSQTAAARSPDHLMMLDELVSEELSAHGGQDEQQMRLDGPDVALPGNIAGTIGLAVHELTTNALKYGALATPSGRVDVRWVVDLTQREDGCETPSLILDWRETGVPLTDLNPRRYGFGRELIEQGLPYEIGASTTLEFRAGGVHCRIAIPLAALEQSDGKLAHRR